jgi:hypothetical protein
MKEGEMRRILLFALAAVAAAAFMGCKQLGAQSDEDRLAASQRPTVPDIPIPKGFKMDLDRQFFNSDQRTGLRSGYITYNGRGTAPALLEFFRDTMPISGWALLRETSGGGSYSLHFEKGNEEIEVKIRPDRFSTDFVVAFFPKTAAKK